ncbi:MAG: hypothetical protein LAT51_06075 [Flavobacteriaceae bacterium]|nr:hypothetical protein [Flavobacteriaceae bacterium]
MSSFKADLGSYLVNSLSKKLNSKVIVFESDDWGAIRMPSNNTLKHLLERGVVLDRPYSKYDSIATDQDLTDLFETLSKYKDSAGNHPIFTFNFIMANPDFERIKKDNFEKYHFKKFEDTIADYPNTENYKTILFNGINEGFCKPQFHGREHVNVNKWLKLLASSHKNAIEAFNHNAYCIDNLGKSIYVTYDYEEDIRSHVNSLTEGLKMFRNAFGFDSETIIFPNYVWSKHLETIVNTLGVKGIQGTKFQNLPKPTGYKRKFRVNGSVNTHGQINLVRNCFFEPSSSKNNRTVSRCLRDINIAFNTGVPAVISTHRLNYISRLSDFNKQNNLKMLSELLESIKKKWPNVLFLSSDQLFKLYL